MGVWSAQPRHITPAPFCRRKEKEMSKGPGTNEEQIKSLQRNLVANDQQKAMSIVSDYTPDIITLAYKLMRANVAKNKLPKAVTKLLDNLPSKEDAKRIRDKLVQAKRWPTSCAVK